MSRIGKLPVTIPQGVTIEKKTPNTVHIKGPKGELSLDVHPRITIEIADGAVKCVRASESKQDRSLHGLSRTLIQNMVEGVTKGFEKKLEIIGVGFRVAVQGSKLTLNIGLSHPVEYAIPQGIKIDIDKDKKNIVIITGTDKQLVGQVAANIRGFRKPEPYKGKGIRYFGEQIVRKAGKAAAKEK
jgi:large subunit ribosomal protein L6